jgi:hypothetical protein
LGARKTFIPYTAGKRTRDRNNSIAEESSVQFEIEKQRAAIPTKDAKKNN